MANREVGIVAEPLIPAPNGAPEIRKSNKTVTYTWKNVKDLANALEAGTFVLKTEVKGLVDGKLPQDVVDAEGKIIKKARGISIFTQGKWGDNQFGGVEFVLQGKALKQKPMVSAKHWFYHLTHSDDDDYMAVYNQLKDGDLHADYMRVNHFFGLELEKLFDKYYPKDCSFNVHRPKDLKLKAPQNPEYLVTPEGKKDISESVDVLQLMREQGKLNVRLGMGWMMKQGDMQMYSGGFLLSLNKFPFLTPVQKEEARLAREAAKAKRKAEDQEEVAKKARTE